jgi:hypothetical protein
LLGDLKPLIARLDPGSFTLFVEGLLQAERERLKLPLNAVVLSGALSEADGGLDGRVDGVPDKAPDGSPAQLPDGTLGLQLKTNKRKQPSVLKLDQELARPGPTRILREGGTYILVWSQDLNDAQRSDTESALQRSAAPVAERPKTEVWDAGSLAALARMHPSVALDAGLADFEDALSLDELKAFVLQANERPFVSDDQRDELLSQIRGRASSTDDPLLCNVLGDPGAGKTRAVAEALDTWGFRDSVLYMNGPEGLGRLLTRLARNSGSRGILFVDEVDDHDVDRALERVAGLGGRWRIVAVTSRSTRRWQPAGPRDFLLEPLSPEATEELIREHSGLPEAQAQLVAEVASGFPELAFRLAAELRGQPDLDLVRLSRLRRPQQVLERALSDPETRRHLGPLALFAGVGFEDEMRYQLEAVADVFDLDPDRLEHHANAELGRFVSRAGRYRLVSPKLVAIWLALELIETTPRFESRPSRLPEPLRDAFVQQLDFFGPQAPHLPDALSRVLADSRFRRPADFDEAAGRLLRASAAIVPTQVANAIATLLATSGQTDLDRIPRRELVWALEILLWWPETWQTALESMYLLARHENEDWANNTSGQFTHFFSVYLSGTTVPYLERVAWLRRRIEDARPDELDLLSRAAATGLKEHHSRSVTGFRAGGQPTDWQPATRGDYFNARRAALVALLACWDRSQGPSERLEITKRLASSLGPAFRSAQGEEVVRLLHERDWAPPERAELATSLRRLLQLQSDEMPESVRESAVKLEQWLQGENLLERLQIALSTPLWDLQADRSDFQDPPPSLRDLASEIAERPDAIRLALLLGPDPVPQTRHRFVSLVAEHLGAAAVGDAALAAEPTDWVALAAALSVADDRNEGEWGTACLQRIAADHPVRLPELVLAADILPDRLELALTAVEEGRSQGAKLANLIYGARFAELEEGQAVRVLDALSSSGEVGFALGMLAQRLERRKDHSPELLARAEALALAAPPDGGTMTQHYLKRLLDIGVLPPKILSTLWEARVARRSGLPDEVDIALTEAALRADPKETLARMVGFIRRQGKGESIFGLVGSESLAFFSRAARATSPDIVWEKLSGLSEKELRWAIHHMSWSGFEPDPLVRRFLISDRLPEIENEAVVCFFNTLGVVSGPFYRGLERELERARTWADALAGTSAEDWCERLIARYKADIEGSRRREAEEDFLLG